MWDPDSSDTTYEVLMVYAMREADGRTSIESDRHVEGLFYREDWLRWMSEAGFTPKVVPFTHSEVDYAAEMFAGSKAE
jgi:hypothetical protein